LSPSDLCGEVISHTHNVTR